MVFVMLSITLTNAHNKFRDLNKPLTLTIGNHNSSCSVCATDMNNTS